LQEAAGRDCGRCDFRKICGNAQVETPLRSGSWHNRRKKGRNLVDKIWKMICNFVADMVYYLRIMMNNPKIQQNWRKWFACNN
jgi:hypothetical protein